MTVYIDAMSSQPEEAVQAMDQYGCFALRNALPAEQVIELREKTEEFFRIARQGPEAVAPLVQRTPEQIKAHAEGAKDRGVIHHAILSLFMYGNPNTLVDRFAKMLAAERVQKFVTPILGSDVLHIGNLALRIREPERPDFALPLHQDGVAYDRQLLDSSHHPIMLVLWVPFTGCDDATPGLELVPQRTRQTYTLSKKPQTKFSYLEADVPTELPIWYPHLAPGDCVVFADMTLHRSYSGPATRVRTSVDLRLFSEGKYPTPLLGSHGIRLSDMKQVTFERPAAA